MANKIITVRELMKLCQGQILLGNGDKQILISSDDEGNSYHSLFYGFTSGENTIRKIKKFADFHDDNNPKDVIILG